MRSRTTRKVRADKGRRSPDAAVPKMKFRLSDIGTTGYSWFMNMCVVLMGLGTTGSKIVDKAARQAKREFGELPACFNYLTVDAASGEHLLDFNRHHRMNLNGAGTDPKVGEAEFLKRYSQLFHTLSSILQDLRPDARMQVTTPVKEAVTCVIVGGNGGASGGFVQPAITLFQDVAREQRIVQPRLNVVSLGPEMPMKDSSRTVTDEQRRTVNQTSFNNFVKVTADHASPELLTECPPGRPAFTLPASQRVHAYASVDQSNGNCQCGTTEDFIEQVAASLFATTFTHVTQSVEDRIADMEMLGTTGRGLRQDLV